MELTVEVANADAAATQRALDAIPSTLQFVVVEVVSQGRCLLIKAVTLDKRTTREQLKSETSRVLQQVNRGWELV